MDFFAQQDHSRRQTRWLVLLFLLAILAMVVVVDLALLLSFGRLYEDGQGGLSLATVSRQWPLLAGGAVVTVGIILLASLVKTLSLRSGGGKVATSLGGVRVDPDSRDPLKRRLVNVVEEVAIASGVPVPEIYLLETEAGINAFAAGYSPADAAVAVTRGTLEKLNRNELQGVIAHEFSHVLNGDMRLNIRLMGILFGILMLGIIGRRVLLHGHLGRSRNRNGAGLLVLAIALMVVGYVGLFFGRWIKAAVSRQREYLADASAVQFTRDPDGIAGALKKIAIYSDGSLLNADTEEVEHMLFSPGRARHLLATHPPLMDRIRRIEPGFQEEELKRLAERLVRRTRAEAEAEAEAAARREQAARRGSGGVDMGGLLGQIGNPDFERLLTAAVLAASLPDRVRESARTAEMAPASLLYSLLDADPDTRDRQLLLVARALGPDSEEAVRHMVLGAGPLDRGQRLALLEIALPALKRLPPEEVRTLLAVMDELIRIDGRLEVFEWVAARLVRQYLWERDNPARARATGQRDLASLGREAADVLAVLAAHGHPDPRVAREAFGAGLAVLGRPGDAELPDPAGWPERLDRSLQRLDELTGEHKRTLVGALVATATHDGRLQPEELELLRAVCAALHVPLPVLSA